MKTFQKRRYLLAFVITAAIFFLGFFFGFLMDLQRVNYFQDVSQSNQLNLKSLQLQYDVALNNNTQEQCKALDFMFNKYILELEQNRERLETYSKQSKVIKEDFDFLRREYVISQINFWYIAQNMKDACKDTTDFVTVIYFYSDTSTCPDCEKESAVLDYYKTQLKQNFLVFALDEKFAETEPLIELLKQSYNVTSYPTLVVNGNKVLNGYTDKGDMKVELCDLYKTNVTKDEICQ